MHHAHRRGVALCVAASVGFGAMAIFAKAAYDGGANVPTLLAVRFTLAALLLWALVLRAGPTRSFTAVRRSPWPAFGLGVLYAVEASAFFFALTRIDAALAELLLYGYPAVVVIAAALLGREALTRARVQALVLSGVGLALVLAAGGISEVDGLGVLAALSSALLYSGYVLAGERVLADVDPLVVSAQVASAAAICFLGYGAATQSIDLGMNAEAWVATLAVTILSTVVAIVAFLKGIQLVGAGTATIVSTVEPVFTVGLAMVVLGERLSPVQLVGGLFVLAALTRLSGPAPGSVTEHEPAVVTSPAAPVGEVREGVAVG